MPAADLGVEAFALEGLGVHRWKPCCFECIGDVELAILVVVDARAEFPVQREHALVALRGPDGFHDAKHLVGPEHPVVVRGAFGRLVLQQQAERLPGDLQITLVLDLIDDPTGRHPTPRSSRVGPEFDIARHGSHFCPLASG